jgi:hypothetical protein
MTRISTVRQYEQRGLNPMSQPRFQFDVRHPDPETARSAAAAVVAWFGGVDLASNDQFGSPAVAPHQFPSFLLNQRAGMDYELQPPVFVQHLDYRFSNLEN